MPLNGARPGDLVLFYRTGDNGTNKKYTSTITTLGVIKEIKVNFTSFEEFLNYCENRSVFSYQQLDSIWKTKGSFVKVIKFIYIKSLTKRPILNDLYELGIVSRGSGVRSSTRIDDNEFYKILKIAKTKLK